MIFKRFMARLLRPHRSLAGPAPTPALLDLPGNDVVRIEPLVSPPPALRPPADGEPPVCGDALLDLALVMRERYWPDAGFGTDADRSLASAALARCFPQDVQTVERCPCDGDPERDPDEPKCDECATDADMRGLDAKLAAFLAPLPRPAIVPPLTDALRALVPPGASFP